MDRPAANFSGYRSADAANRLTAVEASSILSQLSAAIRLGDRAECRKSVARVRDLATGNDRNRRRLASAGAAVVLSTAFHAFSGVAAGPFDILSEILSALVLVFELKDEEVFWGIGAPESMDSIVSILKSRDSSAMLDALLVLKEIVSFDRDLARAAAMIDGLIEALVNLIKDPISPRATKLSLFVTFHLVASAEEWTAARFAGMGMISLILETIVDSGTEKRMSELALSAFERLCGFEQGREKAYDNALTVPVLVRGMIGISDLATDLAVSSLWKLYKSWEGEGGCVVIEALEFGAFLKLLMLLQVDCREGVREKATELMKFLNGRGEGLGCVDSRDFRGLNRPL
ncbi:U-box domain-containing protein 21 [Apostasia shenzhenica]|uniref:U-box domain-containing protein n=1 Tax=Apostasia shenzhenica TaxID=1088818 RepID=A0A2I0B0V3_9ASPA|nr:U-box domain-containing protein 21 [Apostasia shenzhenica]